MKKTRFLRFSACSAVLSPLLFASVTVAADITIADFDGGNFGEWQTTGDAFGSAPATGTLSNQQEVSGFSGSGYASSYHGGDDSTGTLKSPEFKIERKFINFIIGGGGFAGETCINLLVDGQVVRTATGRNTASGGNERMDHQTWDVSEFSGKTASIEIVDQKKGGWGHITVDQIVQSDTAEIIAVNKEFKINKRYLIWPVSATGRDKVQFTFTLEGQQKPFSFSNIAISSTPDFWTFTDLDHFQGGTVTVKGNVPRRLAAAWDMVEISDSYPGMDNLYKEDLRPQFHFTSRRGWLNDPNGLVYHDGKWHLFYQHNPYSHGWDNMHWGHATSTDLFHWTEHPVGLFPDAEGFMFSGSGFVVPKDKTKLPINGKEAIVLAYTAEGNLNYLPDKKVEQGLAITSDGGKTFQKFDGNPVLPYIINQNRDPKVFWHEPSNHWVMALYLDGPDYGIFTSKDLVEWKQTQTYQIPDDTECPDLFPLAVDGDENKILWVNWGAKGRYLLGTFDGEKFHQEGDVQQHYFGAAYAGQSYDNAPNNRRVHFGWLRDGGKGIEGAPFNQQMTLPMDFTLRTENGKPRLHAEPSVEVEGLRAETLDLKDLSFSDGAKDPLADYKGSLFEIQAVIDTKESAGEIGFKIFGEYDAIWNTASQEFSGAHGKVLPIDDKLNVRIFVDKVSLEVFVNGTFISRYIRQHSGKQPIELVSKGGKAKFDSLKIHTLRSVWK